MLAVAAGLGLLALANDAFASLPIVVEGRARAAIVLPAEPSRVAQYAAQELAYHIQKASGAALEVVREGPESKNAEALIFVGPTTAAARAGVEPSKLPPDAFALRTCDHAVFIAGRDSGGKPLDPDTWAGTLFGVYEVLENVMGVRWLWPGELGEHVPPAKSIAIPDLDRTESPQLLIRRLRSTLDGRPGAAAGDTFSPAALKKVRADEEIWLRRQRMGHSRKMRWGHAFTGWWEKYGEEHPDWFNLLEDGKRGPQYGNRGDRTAMCTSSAGFQEQVISNWLKDCAASPDNKPNINGCENDVFGRCQCGTCRSWDVPRKDESEYPERFSKYGIVSDRYARFWRTLQESAAKRDPDAIVTGYAYVNYAPPPVREKLNGQVWIGLVPDAFFPRSETEHRQCLSMWDGWAATGCKLFLRPNYTLEGYCMPYLYMHQFANEFAHHAARGMIATDFDSLTAMWATQGPQCYLFARWQSCLDKNVDQVLAEYYGGFGSAATQVQAYFDEWERYTTSSRDSFAKAATRFNANWATYPRMAHECFPPAAFERSRNLLDEAAVAARADARALARVEFLRKGLTHAEKCAQVSRARAENDFFAVQTALGDLREYRRKIEAENVANLAYCAWIESRAFGEAKRTLTYTGQDLKPIAEKATMDSPLKAISLRGDFGFLGWLEQSEKFRATVAVRKIGKNGAATSWAVTGPNQNKIAAGSIEAGKTGEIEVPVPAKGIYNLILSSSKNAALVTLHNEHAVVLGHELSMIHASGPLWFYVPPRTKSFTVTLRSPAPGETAMLTLLAPDGHESATGSTGAAEKAVLRVQVPPGQDGKPWCVVPSRGPAGAWEDYTIALGDELPPYWALAPDRLLVPGKPSG